jgi:hypothetical protein
VAEPVEQYFDLNVEKVLDHWSPAHAVRELLANALDEHLLGHGGPPEVHRAAPGVWHIRDFGRGLKAAHFTQNENAEKLTSDVVVGRFGVGLKDALAVLDRQRIQVTITTAHADITTSIHSKADFPDTRTLHAVFRPASAPGLKGTDVALHGLPDEEMEEAKAFFLSWSDERVLDATEFGDVIERRDGEPARIYVRGVRVAEEDSFLFSYNITRLSAKLTKALNRERSNVGRQAYTDRVKDILLASESSTVMLQLAEDLGEFETGDQHTESSWVDIGVHASRVLNAQDDVVFVTASELASGGAMFDYARDEGKRLLVVPDKVAGKLAGESDVAGNEIMTLDTYARERTKSFVFSFVGPDELTAAERRVFDATDEVFRLAGVKPGRWPVMVSTTMRPTVAQRQEVGLWDAAEGRVVIRRDQLRDLASYSGTLLHELTHALSGHPDATLEFEEALTDRLGSIAAGVVEPS